MTEARKGNLISFRANDVYLRRIDELSDKLGLSRSGCIRLMLDQGIEKYLNQKGPLLIVNDEKWNEIVNALAGTSRRYRGRIVSIIEKLIPLLRQILTQSQRVIMGRPAECPKPERCPYCNSTEIDDNPKKIGWKICNNCEEGWLAYNGKVLL